MSNQYNVDMIPVRNKIPARQVEVVGKKEMLRLVTAWGLPNAKKIVVEMARQIKAETQRRKKLED